MTENKFVYIKLVFVIIMKKRLIGIVTKNNSAKTITVTIERLVKHPKYEKFLRKKTTLKVHDEKDQAKSGDKVEIIETRPLSKTKRWSLVRVIS